MASGRTPATFAVERAIEQVEAWLATPLDEDVLLTSTTAPPAGYDVEAWRGRLADVITTDVRPALEVFRDVLRDEVAPVMRPDEQCGLSWLPDGEQTYARLLARDTTTTLSAAEIHQIGLDQIASLARSTAPSHPRWSAPTTCRPSTARCARTRPCGTTSTADIVAACETAFAKARGVMPEWFDRLPVADCVVKSTDVGAAAYYYPPADDGSRGGTFYINTADPAHWGRYELEALSYHEGIPGHHLQLAIAGELTDVPKLPQVHDLQRLRRGLGALHRAPRRRDGPLHQPARTARHAHHGLDARLPPGRRHRPARDGLEPAAGRRLHGRELPAQRGRRQGRDRPVCRDARVRRAAT